MLHKLSVQRIMLSVSLLLLLAAWACGDGRLSRWTNLEVRASELAAQGQYDEAVVPAREAIVLAE